MVNPTIGIVTVTHNSDQSLRAFLESIPDSTSTPPVIVVVDNASAEPAGSRALSEAHGATFIGLDENLGYGKAMNRGVAALPPDVDVVILSNPDVVLSRRSLDVLASVIRDDRSVGSAGPLIRNPDLTQYPSARQLPSLRTGVGHALFANTWKTNPWSRRYRNADALGDAVQPVGWLSGACLAVRRNAFESVGGFDDDFFMYFEDVDLGRRFSLAGWRNVFVPAAEVIHTGAHSTAQSSSRMQQEHHISATIYLSKQYPQWYLAPVRLLARAGLAVRSRWTTLRSR